MKIANNIIGNILGKPRVRGGKNDLDGDGVPNKKDCQPRNTMRQDDIGWVKVKWKDSANNVQSSNIPLVTYTDFQLRVLNQGGQIISSKNL